MYLPNAQLIRRKRSSRYWNRIFPLLFWNIWVHILHKEETNILVVQKSILQTKNRWILHEFPSSIHLAKYHIYGSPLWRNLFQHRYNSIFIPPHSMDIQSPPIPRRHIKQTPHHPPIHKHPSPMSLFNPKNLAQPTLITKHPKPNIFLLFIHANNYPCHLIFNFSIHLIPPDKKDENSLRWSKIVFRERKICEIEIEGEYEEHTSVHDECKKWN